MLLSKRPAEKRANATPPSEADALTATVLLVRHAAHGDVGIRLSGRLPGIALTAGGEAQAARLGERLARWDVAAVETSPVERARTTAGRIAAARDPRPEVIKAEALEEIDFGEWTGRDFDELEQDGRWRAWNRERSRGACPGGETMAEAQRRAVDHVEQAPRRHAGGTVVMVTHADIIRAVVARYLGLGLDHVLNFDIDPASVTMLTVGPWGGRINRLNEVPE